MADRRDVEKTPGQAVRSANSPSPPATLVDKRRTPWEKLGFYNLCVLGLGTIAIIIPIAFLAFLWSVSIDKGQSQSHPKLWSQIVKPNWTARVITIATVVTRFALAAQLCVFAAIMAALILERVGTTADDLPLLSMIRCSNSGPQALIWHVLHTLKLRSQFLYTFLIIIAILNALVLQFTSTILLADFDTTWVLLGSNTSQVPWGLQYDANHKAYDVLTGTDFWKSAQVNLPAFAEYKEKPHNGSTFTDTGKVYRSFVPISNSTHRQALRNFNGPMTVLDERVICMQPNVSNVVFAGTNNSDLAYPSWRLGGTINFNGSHPDVIQTQANVAFNCSLPTVFNDTYTDGPWASGFCYLGGGSSWLLNGIMNKGLPNWDDLQANREDKYWTVGGRTWLFMNATGSANFTYEQWIPSISGSGSQITLDRQSADTGPWANVGRNGSTIALSVCFENLTPHVFDGVQVDTAYYTASEDLDVIWNADKRYFNTTYLQNELGVYWDYYTPNVTYAGDDYTEQEYRLILNLANEKNWTAKQTPEMQKYDNKWMTNALSKFLSLDAVTSASNWTFTFLPWAPDDELVHGTYLSLAQNILYNIADPSLVLQSLQHLVFQDAYYTAFGAFDQHKQATFEDSEQRVIPVRWNCFSAIIALLCLHLILMALAIFLFITRTENSLLGNAWQVVAQVHSSDTADAFNHGHKATDNEVTKNIRDSRMADGAMMIKRSELNGRLEAHTVSHR